MIEPQVFFSTVSAEFQSTRTLAALILTRLGFTPVIQDIFGTASGDLLQVIRDKIDRCEGLVQLIGHAYGVEPPTETEFGRVSYTQYEFLYARSKGKKTWLLIVAEGCARDRPIHELDRPDDPNHADPQGYQAERRRLQEAYRAARSSDGHLYHPVSSVEQLQSKLNELRNELDELRQEQREWQASVSEKLTQLTDDRWFTKPRVWLAALVLFVAFAVLGRWMTAGFTRSDPPAHELSDFKVRVVDPEREDFISLVEAAPLKTGSVIQVQVRIPAGVHADLIAVTGTGQLKHRQSYPAQDKARTEYWPKRETGVALVAPTGTEFIFLCGRKDQPASLEELQALWGDDQGWPQLKHPKLLLKASLQGVEEQGERSRELGPEVDISNVNPLRQRLDRFREQVASKYSVFEGVAFRHE